MLDTIRDLCTVVIVIAGAITAVAAAYRVPVVNRPLRWIAHTLIIDPITAGHHRSLDAWFNSAGGPGDRMAMIEHEITTNNGSSLRDVADRVECSTTRIEGRLNNGDQRFDRIEARLDDLASAS